MPRKQKVISQAELATMFDEQAGKRGWKGMVPRYCFPKNIEGEFFPDREYLFKAFTLVKPEEVKYVVLGMDPYPDTIEGSSIPYATGIAFDVPDNVPDDDVPPSLNAFVEKIYDVRKLNTTQEKVKIFRDWIDRNKVLMLNSALTVRRNESGSHLQEWKMFATAICSTLIKRHPSVKSIALGAHARKIICTALEDAEIFTSCNHPSIAHVGGDRSFAKRFRLP